jgi:hypothetical protein
MLTLKKIIKNILHSDAFKHVGALIGFVLICALSASVGNLILSYILVW